MRSGVWEHGLESGITGHGIQVGGEGGLPCEKGGDACRKI